MFLKELNPDKLAVQRSEFTVLHAPVQVLNEDWRSYPLHWCPGMEDIRCDGWRSPIFSGPYCLILENRDAHHDRSALPGHPCKLNLAAKGRDSLAHAQ